jgi:hypothetical protein
MEMIIRIDIRDMIERTEIAHDELVHHVNKISEAILAHAVEYIMRFRIIVE